MWSVFWISLVAATPTNFRAVQQELEPACQTGTLIFSQGDCLAVKVFSTSRFTHVGAVVVEEDGPVVYDSMNGVGVRNLPLVDYLQRQTPGKIQIVHPDEPFSEGETLAYGAYLDSQVGRRYGIKHHVTGKRARGVHCAEYVTDALVAAGRMTAECPPRMSPGALFKELTEHQHYADGGRFALAWEVLPAPERESWGRWAWRSTCAGTTGCCRRLSRWFLCCEK